VTIQLPSGGTTTVPESSAAGVFKTIPGSRAYNPAEKFDLSEAYKKGYGEPTPAIQPSASGPVLAQGGVANPIENIGAEQRGRFGVGSFLDSLRTSPISTALANTLSAPIANAVSRVGQGISNFFSGNTPSASFGTSAGAAPVPTPYQTPSPSPTPTPSASPTAPTAYNTMPKGNINFDIPEGSLEDVRNSTSPLMAQQASPRRYSDYY
jgi:hypothetical protein